jgi:hypothetical protein
MKNQIFLTLILLLGTAWSFRVSAIHNTAAPIVMDAKALAQAMRVEDFLQIDLKDYRSADGKRLKWSQRVALGMVQKNLARNVKKGKIESTATLDQAMAARNKNMFGLLSVIFSVAGLIVPYFGLAMIIAGLVLGIMGIRRDADPTLAIIGTVISSVFLLLLLLVVIAFASGGWWW